MRVGPGMIDSTDREPPNRADAAERLTAAETSIVVANAFSEAVVSLRDGSRLCFCHQVGTRWVKAVGPHDNEDAHGLAGELLSAIQMFRLNAKHLEIKFNDGSTWERKPLAETSQHETC